MASFKERLELALSRQNMTAAELHRKTGIGEGAISQYRKGAYKASQLNLEKIAQALNVSIPWLMGAVNDGDGREAAGVNPQRQELLALIDSLTDDEVARLLQIARLVRGE